MVVLDKGTEVAAALWSKILGGRSVVMVVSGVVDQSTPSRLTFVDEAGGLFLVESKIGKMTASVTRDGKSSDTFNVARLSPLTKKYRLEDFTEALEREVS